MIIVLDKTKVAAQEEVIAILSKASLSFEELVTSAERILCVNDSENLDRRDIEAIPGVKRVVQVGTPYKLVSRESHKENSIVNVLSARVGDVGLAVIAGPCSVEGREEILEIAHIVRDSGAVMLRGGAYKPRTSPYSFQGLGEKGLQYLKEAGEAVGLPVVSEIVSQLNADLMLDYVDVFQIGTRNMQNFELLKTVASKGRPILLKRGLAATIEELLMAAEYLLAHGTNEVILCERGIRTFETFTRNTLDINAIPVLKQYTHLPVIVDPSHATGIRDKVLPVSLASIAAGADGLIVEVHQDPENAFSDGVQSLYPQQFEKLMRDLDVLAQLVSREIFSLRMPEDGGLRKKAGTDVTTKVAFQGEHGSFSEHAVKRYFQDNAAEAVPCKVFRDVFLTLLQGEMQYALIPIENALMGSIHQNYDNLLHFKDVHIIGEIYIRIEHSLIAVPGTKMSDIKRVFSQTPGLEQCRKFLEAQPEWEIIPFRDTAGSVTHVAKEGSKENAAIAHHEVAAMHGLEVLKQGIETSPRNYTRFLVLSVDKKPIQDKEPNKASIVFSANDKPGALFRCLRAISDYGLNLKKIESRPIHGKPWQYMFYLDVELDGTDAFYNAFDELKKDAGECRLLGMYCADRIP